MSELALSPSLLMDIVLIMLVGLAVTYCALLNRRLTKLKDMESGLGGSIVTLTKTIEQTHTAAKDAQGMTKSLSLIHI